MQPPSSYREREQLECVRAHLTQPQRSAIFYQQTLEATANGRLRRCKKRSTYFSFRFYIYYAIKIKQTKRPKVVESFELQTDDCKNEILLKLNHQVKLYHQSTCYRSVSLWHRYANISVVYKGQGRHKMKLQ